jgi:hypothetical protein
MFGLSIHCPVSHETTVGSPMNLKTQPRVCGTNFMEELPAFKMLQNPTMRALHEFHWGNTPHCAISGPKDCPCCAINIPGTIVTGQRRSLSQSLIAVGTKFAYREPRLEVFKDLEGEEGNRRAFICDECTNQRLARPATHAKCASASPATSKEPISRLFKAWRKHSLTGNPFSHGLYSLSQPTPLPLFFSSSQTLRNIPPRILHISSTPPIAWTRQSLD